MIATIILTKKIRITFTLNFPSYLSTQDCNLIIKYKSCMNLITILFFSKNHILVVYDAREQGRNQDLNRRGQSLKP